MLFAMPHGSHLLAAVWFDQLDQGTFMTERMRTIFDVERGIAARDLGGTVRHWDEGWGQAANQVT